MFISFIFSALFSCFNLKEEEFVIADNNLFLTAQEIQNKKNESYLLTESTLFALSPTSTRKGQVLGASKSPERDNIVSYKVKSGDSLDSIAEKFDISVNTVKWANNLNSDSDLEDGKELLILPTTGVLYYVENGDTPSEVARIHDADEEEIMDFNDIKDDSDLKPGDKLIIPDGEKPTINRNTNNNNTNTYNHSFTNPVPGGTITQGAHFYNAVDIFQPCGEPVVAAASGKVVSIGRNTWPAGNFVKIKHNGVVFLYGHLQNIHARNGDSVDQGQQIGTVGNTGKTIGATGCHLHFDALTTRISNPFRGVPIGATP